MPPVARWMPSSNLQPQLASDEVLDPKLKSERDLDVDLAVVNVVLWNLHRQQLFQMDLLHQLQQQIVITAQQQLTGAATDTGSSIGLTSRPVTLAGKQ